MAYLYKTLNYKTLTYETLTTNQIADILRSDEYAGWHKDYDACRALAQGLEDLAEELGEPYELDRVAVRCEFSLYDDIEDYNNQYGTEHEDMHDIDAIVFDIDGTRFIAQDI